MKKACMFFAIFMMALSSYAQETPESGNNFTGTLSFIPDSTLAIETKEEKIYIFVPDEEQNVIFTTSNAKLFNDIYKRLKTVTGDTVISIRGTKVGSLAKIYPQQFKWWANKYKKRGLQLNAETTVYRMSGYKIVTKNGTTILPVINTPSFARADSINTKTIQELINEALNKKKQ